MENKEKRLALAELLHGRLVPTFTAPYHRLEGYTPFNLDGFDPYATDEQGLAQFASVILARPKETYEALGVLMYKEPTQGNILDIILKMNGYELGQE